MGGDGGGDSGTEAGGEPGVEGLEGTAVPGSPSPQNSTRAFLQSKAEPVICR